MLNSITVKAKHLRKGDMIVYSNSVFDSRVYSVETTRDGDILVRVGDDGTGTEFYKPNDLLRIEPR